MMNEDGICQFGKFGQKSVAIATFLERPQTE